MSDTPLLLDVRQVRYWGRSYVITLSKTVRKAIGLKPGDRIAFRKYGRYVFLVVLRDALVAPITQQEIEVARKVLGA